MGRGSTLEYTRFTKTGFRGTGQESSSAESQHTQHSFDFQIVSCIMLQLEYLKIGWMVGAPYESVDPQLIDTALEESTHRLPFTYTA